MKEMKMKTLLCWKTEWIEGGLGPVMMRRPYALVVDDGAQKSQTNHSSDFYWHIYKMPSGGWGGSAAGTVFDGCKDREAALERVVIILCDAVNVLWDDMDSKAPRKDRDTMNAQQRQAILDRAESTADTYFFSPKYRHHTHIALCELEKVCGILGLTVEFGEIVKKHRDESLTPPTSPAGG